MNIKDHIGLAVGAGISILVAGVAVFLLWSFHGKYVAVDQELNAQLQRYSTLVRRNPFPSPENVSQAATNYVDLQQYAQNLLSALIKEQINPTAMERADFPPLVERTLRGLWAAAAEDKVTFPEDFAFGFQRYIDGDLPAPPHIPRLVVQLKTVDAICRLLFSSRISELTDIQRETFDKTKPVAVEEAPRGRGRRRSSRSSAKPKAQQQAGQKMSENFTVEHFKLTFTARENALWTVLNEMAKSPLFIVITSLRFSGEVNRISPISYAKIQEDKIRRMAGAKLTPMQEQLIKRINTDKIYDPPDREARVAAGREVIDVVLECDVYRFREKQTEDMQQ